MSELTVDRLRENLESLKMKNTLEILDNYLERAVADKLNIVEVLDYIFSEEAKFKRKRAYEKQVQVSGFPIKKTLDDFDFSFQPSIDKRQIVEFAAMRFLESRRKCGLSRPAWCRQNPPGFRARPGGCSAQILYILHQLPSTH